MNHPIVTSDSTDHIDFYCGQCRKTLLVAEVLTRPVKYEKGEYICTFIKLNCPACGPQGHRKFYWHTDRPELTDAAG